MQNVSAAYKEQMHQSVRNISKVRVEYGAYNMEATEDAKLSSASGKPYSNLNIKNKEPEKSYFTFEPGRNRLNQGLIVQPPNSEQYLNTGFVSSSMCDNSGVFQNIPKITIEFLHPENILGLTLYFDQITGEYPETIKVNGLEFHPNGAYYIADSQLVGQRSVSIEFIKMKHPNRYARLTGISFGKTVVFTDKDVKKLSISSEIDMLSSKLSKKKLSFTLDNSSLEYNPIANTGMLQFAEEAQPVAVSFGYQLNNKSVEWVSPENMILDSDPYTRGMEVTFTAQDSLSALTRMFRHGLYRPSGITLYDLAKEVLADAGVEKYVLAEHLKTMTTTAALPVATHRECLQVIANAGQCVLYTDRNGSIVIREAFDPKISAYDNGHTPWSSSEHALNTSKPAEQKYADFLPHSTPIGDSRYLILPEDPKKYIRQGFVSSQVCNSSGTFAVHPVYGLKYSFPYSSYVIPITFDNVAGEYAVDFKAKYLRSGKVIDQFAVNGNTEVTYTLRHEVSGFDEIQIEIEKWSIGNRRAIISQIGEGRINDFVIDLGSAKKEPDISKQKQIRSVSVFCHNYIPEGQLKEIYKESVQGANNTLMRISHNGAMNISATFDGGTIVSERHYTHESDIVITGSGTLILKGNPIVASYTDVTKIIGEKGNENSPLKNPLITNVAWAAKEADWLADYYIKRNHIDVVYRGNPELDVYDLIYVSSQFKPIFPVRVSSHTISFNGALSGTIKSLEV